MVVGVEDAARQLDQFALITQQQQAAHPGLGRRHEQRSEPVTRLEQQIRWQTQPGRQIEPVLTDHQHQITAESRRCGAFAQSRKGLGQLVGARAALHLSLGADQGQAIHHPKAALLVRSARRLPSGITTCNSKRLPGGTRGRRLHSSSFSA